MQLKNCKGLALAMAQASAALVGATAPLAHAGDGAWQVDTAALYYAEADGRVQAAEPVVNLKKDYGDERILSFKGVVDSLTGASPNGAAPANVQQTFTGPSGNGTYSANAGELPLDDEFKDTRVALSGSWQQPVGEHTRATVGGNLSSEFDFRSIGLNGALARDLNDKNTTLSAGLALELDSIAPVGSAPKPLTAMDDQLKDGDETRTQVDLLLGVTQIINRHSLFQLNYGLSASSGYHSDPYKMVTVLDASDNLISTGVANEYKYLFEARPDSRMRHSLYAQYKYIFTEDVLDLSYRFTTDDWGIQSNTLDFRYRWNATSSFYVEPHLRYYVQNEADFWKAYLKDGVDVSVGAGVDPVITPLVTEASADPRLGAFTATTVGAKFGWILGRDSEFSVRVEQYDQAADVPAAPATGSLAGQELMPDTSALMVTLGYSFRW
ncbi:MAG: DUF3570 domain-containing protein [Pseudomonadota bacterium]